MDKDKKFLIWFAVIILLIIVGFLLANMNRDKEFVPRDDFDSEEDYLNYIEEYKEAKRNDTYGGKTPEETLDLFVEALKKGDTELASKYFVIEKQNEMREDFNKGMRNGTIELFLPILQKEKIENKLSDDRYRFTTVDKEGFSEFNFDFVLNKETNLWKIKDL